MRKALAVAVICVCGFVGLLLTPGFREALSVAAAPWRLSGTGFGAEFGRQVAAEATRRNDARGLAFAGTILRGRESQELLDRAVALDPSLTWVYYAYVSRNLDSPRGYTGFNFDSAPSLISKLELWDSQNAVPYLLEAKYIRVSRSLPPAAETKDPRWAAAMDRAFHTAKYDSYVARWADLERQVMRDYRIGDPALAMLTVMSYPVPASDPFPYVAQLLGRPLSAIGKSDQNTTATAEQLWMIAHFGERMQLGAETDLERHAASRIQKAAYVPLQKMAASAGRPEEAALLTYNLHDIERTFDHARGQMRNRDVLGWNGTMMQAGSLAVLAFVGLALAAGLLVAGLGIARIARGRRMQSMMFGVSAVVLLVSSAMIYVGYQPLAEIYQRFRMTGEVSELRALLIMWTVWKVPFTISNFWYIRGSLLSWSALVGVGVLVIGWIAVRNLRTMRHTA